MNAILLVLAVIFCSIAALLGFGVFDGAHVLGWLSLGIACGFGSFLVGAVPWPAVRT